MDVDTTSHGLLAMRPTQSTIAQLISVLQDSEATPNTVVVAAPALAGAAIAKWFSLQRLLLQGAFLRRGSICETTAEDANTCRPH
jgi:hypothetical protein